MKGTLIQKFLLAKCGTTTFSKIYYQTSDFLIVHEVLLSRTRSKINRYEVRLELTYEDIRELEVALHDFHRPELKKSLKEMRSDLFFGLPVYYLAYEL